MAARDLDICIVGAGMSGLLMGIVLQKAGIERFRIYEKADSVGGTWRENRYPGLTCDVPSFFYSYSFEPNLEWTHRFSPGPEIRAYFERVAEKYGLLPRISFGEAVESARYEDGGWTIGTSRGATTRADVLVAATGPLHHKNHPEIPGLESFEGACFHTADWHDEVELSGRRIGVVGNKASLGSLAVSSGWDSERAAPMRRMRVLNHDGRPDRPGRAPQHGSHDGNRESPSAAP